MKQEPYRKCLRELGSLSEAAVYLIGYTQHIRCHFVQFLEREGGIRAGCSNPEII